jgi:hypothetical protein
MTKKLTNQSNLNSINKTVRKYIDAMDLCFNNKSHAVPYDLYYLGIWQNKDLKNEILTPYVKLVSLLTKIIHTQEAIELIRAKVRILNNNNLASIKHLAMQSEDVKAFNKEEQNLAKNILEMTQNNPKMPLFAPKTPLENGIFEENIE